MDISKIALVCTVALLEFGVLAILVVGVVWLVSSPGSAAVPLGLKVFDVAICTVYVAVQADIILGLARIITKEIRSSQTQDNTDE